MKTKRVLVYEWKAYLYYDIYEALGSLGYTIDKMQMKLMNYDVDPAFAMAMEKKIRENDYDFVFSVNFFPQIAEVCHDRDLVYACWACDSPLISMYNEAVFYDTNRIFHFDRAREIEFYSMGIKNLWHLPLASNPKRLMTCARALSKSGRYEKYDISFVGRMYEKNSYDVIKDKLDPYTRGYLDSAITAQSRLWGSNITDLIMTSDMMVRLSENFDLKKSPGSFSNLGLIFDTTVIGFKVAYEARVRVLNELSVEFPHDVTLFTSDRADDLQMVRNMGSADYMTEVPYINNMSRINLNLTIPNIRTGIPLRVWDILGAGGFCLTNYQEELEEYFTDGKDLAWFKSDEELLDKAKYYLNHESEREKIAIRGREALTELGDYRDRMSEMLTVI